MPNNQLEKEIFVIYKTDQPSNSLYSVKKIQNMKRGTLGVVCLVVEEDLLV